MIHGLDLLACGLALFGAIGYWTRTKSESDPRYVSAACVERWR